MANANINITELLALLDITPSDQNIMLVGDHGIGKSEILTEYYRTKGMKVVPLFLGQMSDPGDLIGIPNRNETSGKTDFMPPYWFPLDGKPIVLFLDELNRARPEVLQTIMDLALNRTLAGRSLPPGSRIISAVNSGQQYQLTDLDPALVSRFNVLNFRPTAEEWLLWADKNGVDPRVMEFIRQNPFWLDKGPDAKEGADTGLDKIPDRRGWKRVSDILLSAGEISPVVIKAISSIVGPKAASALIQNVSSNRILSGKDVLYHLEANMEKLRSYKLHELTAVNDGIYRHLEVEKVAKTSVPTVSKNAEKYFDFLMKERKEAAAHFADIYVNEIYPNAVSFMARECRVLTMSMVLYIRSIGK